MSLMVTPDATSGAKPSSQARNWRAGRLLGLFLTAVGGLLFWIFFLVCLGMTIRDLRTYWWKDAPAKLTKCEVVEQTRSGAKNRFVLVAEFSFEWQGQHYISDRYTTEEKHDWDHLPLSKIKARLEANPQLRCYVDSSATPPQAILERGDIVGPLTCALLALGGALLMTKLFRLARRTEPPSPGSENAQPRRTKPPDLRWELWGDAIVFLIAIFWATGVRNDTIIKPRLEAERARDWIETPCVILWSRLATASAPVSKTYAADISYRYHFAGREYTASGTAPGKYPSESRGTQKAFAGQFREGQETTCWVNPQAPYEAWLRREPLISGADRFLYHFLFVLSGGAVLHAIVVLKRRRKKSPAPDAAMET